MVALAQAINDGMIWLIRYGANLEEGFHADVHPDAPVPAYLSSKVRRKADVPLSPVPMVRLVPAVDGVKAKKIKVGFKPVDVWMGWEINPAKTFTDKVKIAETLERLVV